MPGYLIIFSIFSFLSIVYRAIFWFRKWGRGGQPHINLGRTEEGADA